MQFLNGYKTWLGLAGVALYATVRTILEVPACTDAFNSHMRSHGIDLGGGIALATLIFGLVHKAEKGGK